MLRTCPRTLAPTVAPPDTRASSNAGLVGYRTLSRPTWLPITRDPVLQLGARDRAQLAAAAYEAGLAQGTPCPRRQSKRPRLLGAPLFPNCRPEVLPPCDAPSGRYIVPKRRSRESLCAAREMGG